MTSGKKEARYYITATGRSPLIEWLEALKDIQGRAIIKVRIRRMEEGNWGSFKPIGQGVCELKIPFGPGYRVYFGEDGDRLIILLCGGDKGSQDRDITRAHRYWADYRRNK